MQQKFAILNSCTFRLAFRTNTIWCLLSKWFLYWRANWVGAPRRTLPINHRKPRTRDLNQGTEQSDGTRVQVGMRLHIIAGVSIRISCHRNYVQAGDQEIYSLSRSCVSGDPMENINFIIIDNIVSHVYSLIYAPIGQLVKPAFDAHTRFMISVTWPRTLLVDACGGSVLACPATERLSV